MALDGSLLILFILTALPAINGKEHRSNRRVVIHVPYKIEHYYHTHTIIRHIHQDRGKYEFLGYSVGSPHEAKNDAVPGTSKQQQQFRDVGHTFQDGEHSVVNGINSAPKPPPGPVFNEQNFRYVQNDGNEYGFEGAGRHVDDNFGQKIKVSVKTKLKPEEHGKPPNQPEKDPDIAYDYSEVLGNDHSFGPMNLTGLKDDGGGTGYGFKSSVSDNGKEYDPDSGDIYDSDSEVGYGMKSYSFGKEAPEMKDSYGIKMYNFGKDSSGKKEIYEMKHYNFGKESPEGKDGYGGKGYAYEKEIPETKENYGGMNNYNFVTLPPNAEMKGYEIKNQSNRKEVKSPEMEKNYGQGKDRESYDASNHKTLSEVNNSFSYENKEEKDHDGSESKIPGFSFDKGLEANEQDYDSEYDYETEYFQDMTGDFGQKKSPDSNDARNQNIGPIVGKGFSKEEISHRPLKEQFRPKENNYNIQQESIIDGHYDIGEEEYYYDDEYYYE